MAIIQGSPSTNTWDIDSDHNGRASIRPPAFGALGYYRIATSTGAIAATLAAASPLFSFRWTDATRFALIQSIRVAGIVTAAVTTGVPFDLAVTFARSFTVSDSGGTAVTPTATGQKLRTSMGSSLVGDVRVATTGLLTAGTRTLDASPIGRVQGFTGTTLGTVLFGSGNGSVPLYYRDNNDHHPIILAQNEGIVVTAPLAGPATGTLTLLVQIEWGEVAAY